MATTEDQLKMLEATGKIDSIGTSKPGMLIDLYNQRLTEKKEKAFANLVSDMNEYYFKLLIDTVTQRQGGILNPIYKSNTTLFHTPEKKILIPS